MGWIQHFGIIAKFNFNKTSHGPFVALLIGYISLRNNQIIKICL